MSDSAAGPARRLFDHPDAASARALWVDGGGLPGSHRIAANPDRVDSVRVADLPFRGLVEWLRERLPARHGDGHLYAVLLSYDAGRNLERIPATAAEDPVLPDVLVARYPAWLEAPSSHGPWSCQGVDEAARRGLRTRLDELPAQDASRSKQTLPTSLQSSMSSERHAAALRDVLHGIAAGELYQANVARRLVAPFDAAATPLLYRHLRQASAAEYGVLWAFDDDRWIASISPECLLKWDPATGTAASYPIKGTRPRGVTAADDARLAAELRADAKERAEHVMIVDLVRNDLGRVAVPGGVRVDDLFGVRTFPTVHHLVSEVTANVRDDQDLADILAALFPGGSITGAPKIAAMARIEKVEGLRRGFYTGSFGVVGPDGRATFNILIRTCVIAEGRLMYQTGGGIVADSDAAQEWEETEVKARALREALAAAARP